jgi:hypothetical protein
MGAPSDLQRVTISLPAETVAALRRTAAERGTTVSQLLEELAERERARSSRYTAPDRTPRERTAPFTEAEYAQIRERVPWAGLVATDRLTDDVFTEIHRDHPMTGMFSDSTLDAANLDDYLEEFWADDIARDSRLLDDDHSYLQPVKPLTPEEYAEVQDRYPFVGLFASDELRDKVR